MLEPQLWPYEFWRDQDEEVILELLSGVPFIGNGPPDTHQPLHNAAGANRGIRIIKALLDRRTDPDAVNHNGNTPLHIAAQRTTHLDVIVELAMRSNSINSVNKEGNTPLHCARRDNPSPEISQALLKCGANPTVSNIHGETPVSILSVPSHSDISFLTVQRGFPVLKIQQSAQRRILSRWQQWEPTIPQEVLNVVLHDDALWQVWLRNDMAWLWDESEQYDTNLALWWIRYCVIDGQWWRHYAERAGWNFSEWPWQKRWAFERTAVRESINSESKTPQNQIDSLRLSVVDQMGVWHLTFDEDHPNGLSPLDIPLSYWNLRLNLI